MTAKISHYKEELNRTIEWLKFAEQKFTLLSVYYGLGITFLIANSEKIILFYNKPIFGYIYIFKGLVIFGFLVSMLSGIYFLLKIVFPRLNNLSTNNSLFYFGHISKMKVLDYIREMGHLTNADIENQLLEQIHTNSIITNEKMINIKCSSIYLFINLSLLIILTFLL